MSRSVYYWNHSDPSINSGQAGSTPLQSRIYLLGNPVIWWASTVAILYLLFSSILAPFHRIKPKLVPALSKLNVPILLTGAYLLNILPFIGITRAMFLYHYFPSMIFSVLALAYWTNRLNKKNIFAFLLTIFITGFLYFSPLTYGLSISPQIQNRLFWFASWR
jgi:dolichyl-phosphate-mannose--protein O-mannosyl transferase